MREIIGIPFSVLPEVGHLREVPLKQKLAMEALVNKDGLVAPLGFWLLTPKEKAGICNGAGSRGLGWLVPDTFHGVSVAGPADIHDYCWEIGQITFGNNLFRQNMAAVIQALPEPRRKHATRHAFIYWAAVAYIGGPIYRAGSFLFGI